MSGRSRWISLAALLLLLLGCTSSQPTSDRGDGMVLELKAAGLEWGGFAGNAIAPAYLTRSQRLTYVHVATLQVRIDDPLDEGHLTVTRVPADNAVVVTGRYRAVMAALRALDALEIAAMPRTSERIALTYYDAESMIAVVRNRYLSSLDEHDVESPGLVTADAIEGGHAVVLRGPQPLVLPLAAELREMEAARGRVVNTLDTFERRYGIWFVGELLPGWIKLDLPANATAGEAIARLRAALKRNPAAPAPMRVVGLQDDAARRAVEESYGYRVEEVAGSGGRVFALIEGGVPASALPAFSGAESPPAATTASQATIVMQGRPGFNTFEAMAQQFGYVIIQGGQIWGQPINPPRTVGAAESVRVLDESLRAQTMGGLLVTQTDGRTIFRVSDVKEWIYAGITYGYGVDLSRIPQTNEFRTQIMPFKYLTPRQAYEVMQPMMTDQPSWYRWGSDGRDGVDYQHNCMLATHSSALIYRLAEMLSLYDAAASPRITRTFPLNNAKPENVVAAIAPKHRTGPTRGGQPAPPSFIIADPRGNGVILNGPSVLVEREAANIAAMDAAAKP